jgi:hypothetical protein
MDFFMKLPRNKKEFALFMARSLNSTTDSKNGNVEITSDKRWKE